MDERAYQANIWSYFQNTQSLRVFSDAGARHEALLRRAAGLVTRPQPAVMNIGVGDGNLEGLAHARGWQVASLDPDEQAIARLRQQGIDARSGTITRLPFDDNQFDLVFATEVLEHLAADDRRAGLAEIRRVLKPGGWLLGTVPNREVLEQSITICPCCSHVFHRWGHEASFDTATMRAELAEHFANVDCRVTAFVKFRGSSIGQKLKNAARVALAKLGSSLVWSNIFFVAQK